jgi:thiol-disulfide isomerase/thioredoxin
MKYFLMNEFPGIKIMYNVCLIANLIIVIIFSGCKSENTGDKTRVIFHIDHAAGRYVYIETFPYTNEGKSILDSAQIIGGKAITELTVTGIEERPLSLRVSESEVKIVFVNDAPEIIIKGNILKPDEYSIEQSPGMKAYNNFFKEQKIRQAVWAPVLDEIKTMKEKGVKGKKYDSLIVAYNRFTDTFFTRNKNFADTISSPGVFLYVYNYADFGNDYIGLKNYMNRAIARFPNHSRIRQLHKETLEYLKIFEEEFNPGDILPVIQLPDTSGNDYNTLLTTGKFVFIDFWATWCGTCLQYDKIKQKAKTIFPPEKFEIISIALDPEKDFWKAHILGNKIKWIQLLDEKVWEGKTRRVFKIDSIPFNFLIGPERKVLRKAIPPESVISVLSTYVK